jgi:hypothetical protein
MVSNVCLEKYLREFGICIRRIYPSDVDVSLLPQPSPPLYGADARLLNRLTLGVLMTGSERALRHQFFLRSNVDRTTHAVFRKF